MHTKIKVDRDNRDSACFGCGSTDQVLFVLVRSVNRDKNLWARLCPKCLNEIHHKAMTLLKGA